MSEINNNKIDEIISQMTLKQKIGQMICAGLNTTYVDDEFVNLIKDYPFGAVGLFNRNIETIEQLKELTKEIQKTVMPACHNIEAMIAIDEEGGIASQFFLDNTRIPGNLALGAAGSESSSFACGHIVGSELCEAGITINWSPVMDLNVNPLNKVIDVRSFGDNIETVSNMGISMAKGLNKGGIGATAKHFPGHGSTSTDSHIDLPVNSNSLEYLLQNDIIPFKRCIDEGINAIMVGHIAIPAVENGEILPSSLSYEVITNILRNRLNYNGVIMTDDLQMDAIANKYTVRKAAIMAIMAGADMVLICNSRQHQISVFNGLLSAAEKGKISIERIDESVKRILQMKLLLRELRNFRVPLSTLEKSQSIKKACQRTITLVKDPLKLIPADKNRYKNVLVVVPKMTSLSRADISENIQCNLGEYISAEFEMTRIEMPSLSLSEEEADRILSLGKCSDLVIIASENAREFPEYLKLIESLGKLKPLIIVSLRYPYEINFFPAEASVIAAYSFIDTSMEAVKDVLCGNIEPEGKLPVKL